MPKAIDMRRVYPVEGRRLRDPGHPQRSAIPAEGRFVQWGTYWELALQAGDITLDAPPGGPPAAAPDPVVDPPAAKPAKAAPAPAPPPAAAPADPPAADVKG